MKILLVGGGGREHALAWKIRQSPLVTDVIVAPGNVGTAALGRNVLVRADDVDGQVALAQTEQPDLIVVGPDNPLALGLVDRLQAVGITTFGPTAAAARIEASKAFAKDLMERAGIPTARFYVADDYDQGVRWVLEQNTPFVVKADGLALGKGVVVADNVAETLQALRAMLHERAFGAAGARVVLEERLSGVEVSVFAFTDGRSVVPMPPTQDHKRLLDGDAGPNTGGMGAYAPVPQIDHALHAELVRIAIQPAVDALAAAGCPFVGVLYAGVMLTADGPRVLEFNARWGDPEAQVLLPLLDADLVPIMLACVDGRLTPDLVRWHDQSALTVVLAAANYPATPRTGDPVTIPTQLPPDTLLFHAGTTTRDEQVVAAGGRVLNAVGVGATLKEAHARAYALAEQVQFAGKQLRNDIGWRGLHEG
jgi:phosphoribosylamine--glycine ligase